MGCGIKESILDRRSRCPLISKSTKCGKTRGGGELRRRVIKKSPKPGRTRGTGRLDTIVGRWDRLSNLPRHKPVPRNHSPSVFVMGKQSREQGRGDRKDSIPSFHEIFRCGLDHHVVHLVSLSHHANLRKPCDRVDDQRVSCHSIELVGQD